MLHAVHTTSSTSQFCLLWNVTKLWIFMCSCSVVIPPLPWFPMTISVFSWKCGDRKLRQANFWIHREISLVENKARKAIHSYRLEKIVGIFHCQAKSHVHMLFLYFLCFRLLKGHCGVRSTSVPLSWKFPYAEIHGNVDEDWTVLMIS